jgi:hypothetical protein
MIFLLIIITGIGYDRPIFVIFFASRRPFLKFIIVFLLKKQVNFIKLSFLFKIWLIYVIYYFVNVAVLRFVK